MKSSIIRELVSQWTAKFVCTIWCWISSRLFLFFSSDIFGCPTSFCVAPGYRIVLPCHHFLYSLVAQNFPFSSATRSSLFASYPASSSDFPCCVFSFFGLLLFCSCFRLLLISSLFRPSIASLRTFPVLQCVIFSCSTVKLLTAHRCIPS